MFLECKFLNKLINYLIVEQYLWNLAKIKIYYLLIITEMAANICGIKHK